MQADKFATQFLGSFWSKHRFKLLGAFLFFVFIIALNYLLELTFFTQEAAKIEHLGEQPIVEGAKFVNIDSPQFVDIEEHIDLPTPPTPKPEIFRWESDKIYPRSESTFFDWYEAPIVNHEHKLLFCWIPKNSCTKFKLLLAELSQDNVVDWLENHRTEEGQDWEVEETIHLHMNHLFNRTIKLKRDGVDKILDDPEYHKIVFIRDPIERFVSGFWDKCGPNGTRKVMCKNKDLTGFINYMYEEHYLKKTLCEIRDHFRAQWCFCDLYRNKMDDWDVYAFDGKSRGDRIQQFITAYHFEDHAHFFKHGTSHAGKQKLKTPLEELLDKETLARLYKVFENDMRLYQYYSS